MSINLKITELLIEDSRPKIDQVPFTGYLDIIDGETNVKSITNTEHSNLEKNKNFMEEKIMLEKIQEEFFKRKLLSILHMEYALGENLPPKFQVLHDREQHLKQQLREKNARDHQNGFLWVTINPDASICSLPRFLKLIDKMAKRKCFEDYIYVIEQRATTLALLGKGYHAHLLLKRNLNYKPCKCAENIRNSSKKFVKNPKNNQLINIQIVGQEFAEDKLDYILGIKTGEKANGEKKSIAQKLDPLFRKNEKIAEFYGNKDLI